MKSGEDQKKFITSVFNQVAAGYDNEAMRYFPFSADHLVDILTLPAQAKVLDIATGTGVAAATAAQIVGPQGRVIGIDLAESMLIQAQQRCQRLGLENLDWHVMDAEALEFRKEYFDAAMCSFGVFFLSDIDRAVRHWRDYLKPNASLGFTTFSKSAFQPYLAEFETQCERYGIAQEKQHPSVFERLMQADACHDLLQQAGYSDIEVTQKQMGYHLPAIHDWWTIVWNSGLRATLMQLEDDALRRFEQEHLATLEKYIKSEGLYVDVEVLFSHAKK